MSQVDAQQEKNLSLPTASCASLVIEHRVSKEKEPAFYNWQDSLNAAVSNFAGYLRTDISPPVTGAQEKWYVIVYFDNQGNLNKWVNSPERLTLIKEGEKLFGSYKYRSFKTGLESWFTTEADESEITIPAWKQNLIVLLGLYPTVMLQTLLFSAFGIMKNWPLSISMLVNNFICASLLTWVVIPPLSWAFQFWLKDASEKSLSVNLKALAIILTALACFVAIFFYLNDRTSFPWYNFF